MTTDYNPGDKPVDYMIGLPVELVKSLFQSGRYAYPVINIKCAVKLTNTKII